MRNGDEVKQIDLIAGARPNFMKIAPIIDAMKASQAKGWNVAVSPDPYRATL